MRCSPRQRLGLALVCLSAPSCAGRQDPVERDYAEHEFNVRGAQARAVLVHAAYLPRGVAFEVVLENAGNRPLRVERDGILLAYQGLEYPLDSPLEADGNADADATIELAPGEEHILRLDFRLGRSMSETGWIVLRGLRAAGKYAEPLWLEVPAAPSKLDIESRSGGAKKRGR